MKVTELLVFIENVRFKKMLSQVKFALLLGMSAFTYMKTVNGTTKPSFVTLGRMVNYLNEIGHSIELERD